MKEIRAAFYSHVDESPHMGESVEDGVTIARAWET